jgi:hypothetical protein
MALRFLAVGTGRDGTVSLTRIVNDVFQLNGIRSEAAHEHLARECYNAYCLFKETGDIDHLNRLREQIRACPYDAVIGNGYASVLPIFLELFPDLALIHVRRRDREAVIHSHVKTSRLFPETYLNYGAVEGTMRRVAAFHEGEMPREVWNSLSLHDRFGWFYDDTHRKIAEASANFSRCISVETESLSSRETLEAISRFILGKEGATPAAAHLNRHVYLSVEDFTESSRSYGQWLFGTLSAQAVERDPLYLSEYVTNKFIAFTGYQLSGFIKEFAPSQALAPEALSSSLDRFEALMDARLKEVRSLKSAFLESMRGSLPSSESLVETDNARIEKPAA